MSVTMSEQSIVHATVSLREPHNQPWLMKGNKLRLHRYCAAEEARDGYRSRTIPRSNIAVRFLAPLCFPITRGAGEGIIL